MKLKGVVKVIGVCLILLHGALLYIWFESSGNIFEFILIFLLLTASIGVMISKEWGRQLLVFSAVIGIMYFFADSIFIRNRFDFIYALYAATWALIISFFQRPIVRQMYQLGFDTPPWKILAIDDDKGFLKLLQAHFLRQGIKLLTAETGEEGLRLAAEHVPDLIVLDVILPGMKGREVCARLKEDSRTREIPIVFLTIKDTIDDIIAEQEVGAVYHITKPLNFNRFYLQIKKILS